MKNKGFIFIITGPSGSGKTTIAQKTMENISSLKKVITCTTRDKREGEKDGVDYRFFSKKKFESFIKKDAFAEHALVYTNYYGSLKKDVDAVLKKSNALFVVDVQGAFFLSKTYPFAKTIFIKTPSLQVLRERLSVRGKDSKEKIELRLKEAKKELELENKFDFVVVNDDLNRAINEVEKIILSLSN